MRRLIGVVLFAALLVLMGLAGEDDRRTAIGYEPLRQEIYASAETWAVRR